MRVICWGTCDVARPRNKINMRGLRSQGVELVECHEDAWQGASDKSRISGVGAWFRVAALVGKVIAVAWLSARDKQDKEVEWRNHAIELTWLDPERKLRARGKHDSRPLRPSIMDFLANYRDLQVVDRRSGLRSGEST